MTPHMRVKMLIPSRGRPEQAMEAATSAMGLASLPNTSVVVIADGHGWSSNEGAQYGAAWDSMRAKLPNIDVQMRFQADHLGLVGTLNSAAVVEVSGTELMSEHHCRRVYCGRTTHIGFMGDDHRVRTAGWDYTLATAAGPWGVAYGDDGIQHENLPTAVVMSADIVRVLGKMGPPTLYHMYVDNYWEELGRGIGRLIYMPNVRIEHLHPSAGLAEIDESYERTNAPEQYERDSAAWELYRRGQLLDDVERVVWHRDEPERRAAQYRQIATRTIPLSPSVIADPLGRSE